MAHRFAFWLTSLGLTTPFALAQLLNNTFIPFPPFSVSSACSDALNTSVSCPAFLSSISYTKEILSSELAEGLCVDSCLSSLQSARSAIAQACNQPSDIMIVEHVAYPATFMVDEYILAYNTSCTKDAHGNLCDPQILSWQAGAGLNDITACSDCYLKSQRNALNGPLGYDPDAAVMYASLTSSCNATTGYAVTSPATYAYNATATTQPATTTRATLPECSGGYTVQASDTCNSVAQTMGVSTYNLLQYNGLDIYCQNFHASVGQTLCQPPQCPLYTWQALDTCASVVGQLSNVTIPQFLAWNPNFNDLCQNTLSFVGYLVCLGNPGGTLSEPSATTTGAGGSAVTTAQPAPTNSVNGTTTKCGRWYTVQYGDNCGKISIAAGIALSDFYLLNPEISSDCTNLWLGYAYCVAPVGDISTYPGYPQTTALITVTSATFSSVNTGIPTSTSSPGYVATTSLLPTASGTIPGCDTYKNYNGTDGHGSCSDIAANYLVSVELLQKWNPSLSTDASTCSLQPGYSYCVLQSSTNASTRPNYCLSINATMPGTISSCTCFTAVQGYLVGDYGCAALASDYSISSDDLKTWNPWLGSDCDAGLYANLNASDSRSVCIGVNGTRGLHRRRLSPQPSTTASQSTGPTQSGEVSGCQQHYTVKSGDGCAAIDSQFGITFAQLYSWNPSIGDNCQYLVIGDSYCVKGPASSTTSNPASSTSPFMGPTQSGEVAGCQEHYTVQSGDSCWAIESTYNITFSQLYEWNPSIASNCQYLVIGDAYCVKAPP